MSLSSAVLAFAVTISYPRIFKFEIDLSSFPKKRWVLDSIVSQSRDLNTLEFLVDFLKVRFGDNGEF